MSDEKTETNNKKDDVNTSRRDFLKNIGVAGASTLMATGAAAEISAEPTNPDAEITAGEMFQGHFVLMSDEEKQQAIDRLEKRYSANMQRRPPLRIRPLWKACYSVMPSISANA